VPARGEESKATMNVTPATPHSNSDGIPIEMKSFPQWLTWIVAKRNGKPTKMPLNPATGRPAKANDPNTWGTFEESRDDCRRNRRNGIGYVFATDDPFFGVDLDACRNPATGELTPWARRIVEKINSYTEVSPSGFGVKIVGKGKLRAGHNVKKLCDVPTFGDKAPEVALYDDRRFWCMTGQHYPGTPTRIEKRQSELDSLCDELWRAKKGVATNGAPHKRNGAAIGRWLDDLLADCATVPDGQRSERDYALCAAAVRHGCDAEEIWQRVANTGKFREGGHRYFEATWQKAAKAVAETPGTASNKVNAAKLDPGDEARAFLESSQLDGVFRLRFWRGTWWRWARGSYRECDAGEVRAILLRKLDTGYHHLGMTTTSNVLDHMKAHAILASERQPPAWIIKPPTGWAADEVLATRSKLVHLPSLATGCDCTTGATPRFFTTAALDFDFDPIAPRPAAWLQFLHQLWPDDAESIDTLQEWIGYLLIVDTRQQKILLLVGPKRSGKGTIARVVRELVGRGNVAAPTLAGLATNFGLWPLLGKAVAIISDARLGNRSDQSVVVERLLSISGEDALTIDRKFLDPVTCKLSSRLMILSNELPRLSDASGAIAGRFIVLRLTESFFGHEDPDLTAKLLSELPSILLWAIEGWQRLRARGRFAQPEAGEELLGQLHDLTSPVGAFVLDLCNVGPQYRASVQELFAAWKTWCESAGRKEPGTEATFGRDLLAAVPTLRRIRPRENGDRYRAYEGIRLMAD
jgi:putative DNA primase/helicase